MTAWGRRLERVLSELEYIRKLARLERETIGVPVGFINALRRVYKDTFDKMITDPDMLARFTLAMGESGLCSCRNIGPKGARALMAWATERCRKHWPTQPTPGIAYGLFGPATESELTPSGVQW